MIKKSNIRKQIEAPEEKSWTSSTLSVNSLSIFNGQLQPENQNLKDLLFILIKPLIQQIVDEALSNLPATGIISEPEETLLTVKKAAAFLDVSEVTIHTWKREGQIPFHRKGRRVYFKKHELQASLKSGTQIR